MSAKKPRKLRQPFDDSYLPVNDLSPERVDQIEKIVLPRLDAAFQKLREERPELFRAKK